MSDIYITGDTHGRIDIAKLKLFDKPCDLYDNCRRFWCTICSL